MNFFSFTSLLFVFFLSSFCLAQDQSFGCYLPNGTDRNSQPDAQLPDGSGAYTPCDPTKPSMCCGTRGGRTDVCMPNGLCNATGTIYRESCTDPTWQDPACVRLFIDGINSHGLEESQYDQHITPCPDGSWCPNENNSTCCFEHQGLWIWPNRTISSVQPPSSTSSEAASSTSLSAPSSTSSPSSASSGSPTSQLASSTASVTGTAVDADTSTAPAVAAHSNTGAVAGGVIGSIAALGLIAFLIYFFVIRRRRQQANGLPLPNGPSELDHSPAKPHMQTQPNYPPAYTPSYPTKADYAQYASKVEYYQQQHQLQQQQPFDDSRAVHEAPTPPPPQVIHQNVHEMY